MNILCTREIKSYLKKCGNMGKIGDILYISFQKKEKYDRTFYKSICKIIQHKIIENKN